MGSTTTLTLGSNATINGGAAANDDLTLQGTSDSTRTTSYVLLQPNGGYVGVGGDTTPDALFSVGSTSQFQVNTSGNVTYVSGTSDTATLVCRNAAGQLAACNASYATGSGTAFLLGGNTVAANTDFGLNANFDLNFLTNSTTKMTLQADGDLAVDAADTTFFVDATNNRVGIGKVSDGSALEVNGSIEANLFRSTGADGNNGLVNNSTSNNGAVQVNTTGVVAQRNVADANVALQVKQLHASSTGDILQLQNSAGTVVSVARAGNVTLSAASGTGLSFNNTGLGTDISLQNGETIDNDTNNQINLNLGTSGTLLLTSGTAATIANSAGQLNVNPFNGTLASTATTFSASSLATFTTAASLSMGSTTTLTLGSNATINGGAAANDDLTLQGTSNGTRTTSYVLLQPTAGNVAVGNSAPDTKLHVSGGTEATLSNGSGSFVIGAVAGANTVFDENEVQARNNTATATFQLNPAGGDVSIGDDSGNADLFFGNGGNHALYVETTGTNAVGLNLTVRAGTAGSGASAFAGGLLTLQGGAAAGTGNANGGAVTVVGGAGVGTGTQGLVNLSTSAFTSAAEQSFGSSTSITAGNVDLYSSLPVKATAASLTLTIPDPAQNAVGRLLYISARSGSSDFTMRLNAARTPIDIAMKANSTATLIWNGTDWTAAGASSSTDLQSAYNNTLTSAGGAELVLNAPGGNADGLTIRNNGTTPIVGALLEVQTSIGSSLFSVNNNATEYSNNGGAESSTFTMWPTIPTGGSTATITRDTTAGEFATGQASVKVVTTGSTTANQGVANTLSSTLTANLVYSVSFTVKGSTNFSTLDVMFSKDGTNSSLTTCTTGSTVTQSVWSRINCSFTAPSSGITSSNAIFIRQSNSNSVAKTFYIDNLSVTVKASTSHAADGSVDSALGTNWTAYDADGGAGTSTPTRDTTTIYDTSGSVADVTTAHINEGVRNNMSITPQVSTQYLVTFYARSSNTFNDITVGFLPAGGSSAPVAAQLCTDYNTQAVSTTGWTKITCIITTPSSGISDPDLVIYQPTATARTFYVDALSITLNTNTASNVQVGGGNKGGPATLFTLDRSSGAPIADNNDTYLGSMYYDTSTGRIQCYEADGWGACGAAPDNIVNLNPEYTGAVLNGNGVGTMTADFCSNDTALSINTSLCSTGQAKNYYNWTSPQATSQTYSIYVTYQLPATFNGFSSDDTVQLVGRVDNTTNASVTYEMFKSTGSAVTQCGSSTTNVITGGGGSANTWYSYGINGNEATGCSFNSASAGNFIIFKINMTAKSGANAYVSTLSFTTTGR